MNHDELDAIVGVAGASLGAAIREVEPLGELVVELDCCALVLALVRVRNGDVDLGPLERAISGIYLPLARHKLVERLGEHLLSENAIVRVTGENWRQRTASALSQVSISPRNLSGRVESLRSKSKSKMP